MSKLIMSVHRKGYSTSQIYETMTVGELIDYLGQFDDDTPVYTSHDNGYTYGGISWYDFNEVDEDEESEDE